MPPTPTHSPNVPAAKVLAGVLFILLATAPALSWWGDGKEACLGAHSWINVGQPLTNGPDGKSMVSVRPLLFTLSCLPSATLLPLPTPDENPFVRLARAFFPSLFGAGCAAIFFLVLSRLRVHRRTSVMLSVALVFATPLWIYSRIHYSEGLQTLLNLCLLYFLMERDSNPQRAGLASGFFTGMLLNIRTTNLLLLPFALIGLVTGDKAKPRQFLSWIWFLAGFIPWALAWAAFNQFRYGSATVTGYEPVNVWRNPMTGIFGQILSPGKSIFLYAPLTLAGVWIFLNQCAANRRNFRLVGPESLLAVVFIANLVLYSSWWAWGGGWAWGPRFLLPFVPLMIVPLAQKIATDPSRTLRNLTAALCATGIVIQIPVVLAGIHPLLQLLGLIDRAAFATTPVFEGTADDTILSNFVPDFSPVVMQFRLLADMATQSGNFSMDLSSWGGDHGPYRIPGLTGRILTFDPVHPDLWFWKSGAASQWGYPLGVALALLIAGYLILASALRPVRNPDSITST